MPRGRCPGCGKTDVSHRKIEAHMVQCADVAALYRDQPDRVIAPTAEYVRWLREENNPTIRAEKRTRRVDGLIQEIGKKLAVQDKRWETPNLLDD